MTLEATVDSLDAVPETVRDDYVKGEDGRFHLKILADYVPADKVEDTTGLKSALQKERDARAAAERRNKEVQEKYAGIDLEEVEQLRQERAAREEEEAKKAGEWDKLKDQMVSRHNEDLAAKDKELGSMRGELERHLVDSQATAAINKLEGNVTLLLPHVKNLIRLVKGDDGQYRPQVVDHSGTPRVNGEGNPLSIEDLVREMREQDVFAGAFKGTNQSGSGTPPADGGEGGGGGGGGKPPNGKPPAEGKARSTMTPREKVEYIKEHGQDAFMELPA